VAEDLTRYSSVDLDVARPPRERYQFLGRIGATRTAEIYLARLFTGAGGWQELIVRRLKPELQASATFAKTFIENALRAASLHHENIAEVREIGVIEGASFVATELIRGVSVRDLHQQALQRGDAIPTQFALKIASDVLNVLSLAHEAFDEAGHASPIYHLGVSPEVLYVTFKGVVKLTDFGGPSAEARMNKGRSTQKKRSPYLAPEQLMGEEGDARADVFSVGVMLYELALNRHPLTDLGAPDMLQVVSSGGSPSAGLAKATIPPALSIILERALAPRPESRYYAAKPMMDAIDTLQRDRARPASTENLGRFVQDLFAERLKKEERARLERDDTLLVECMQLGTPGYARDPSRAVAAATGLDSSALATVTPEMNLSAEDVLAPSPEDPRGRYVDEAEETSPGRPNEVVPHVERVVTYDEEVVGGYRLVDRIGYGSVAEVFLARRIDATAPDPPVALKRILPPLARERQFIETLMSEARLAGRLNHPNVVSVFEFGVDSRQQHYLVMEYIEGWDLEDVLNACRRRKLLVPAPIALRIMSHVSAGLYAGHSARGDDGVPLRIVHRDVAPQNILLSKTGAVKLTDFGIAKASDSALATRVGEIRGKPAYMAPERIVPDDDHSRLGSLMSATADEKADIFSVGAVLYELLTLEPLFRRATPFETLMAAQRDPIPEVTARRKDAPKLLDAIIQKAASRWPNERYPTALALQVEIERALEDTGQQINSSHIAAWLHHIFEPSGDDLNTEAGIQLDSEGDEIRTAVEKRRR
jgi:serine/threonine protein kinase